MNINPSSLISLVGIDVVAGVGVDVDVVFTPSATPKLSIVVSGLLLEGFVSLPGDVLDGKLDVGVDVGFGVGVGVGVTKFKEIGVGV